VDIPLVLHGGSSTGDERLAQAARSGICKINISTDAGEGGISLVKQREAEGKLRGPLLFTQNAFLEGFSGVIRHYIELFGAAGRY